MAEQIKNINFNLNTKQKFTIDGDTDKVIELDLNDLNIVNRYNYAMSKMNELREKYEALNTVAHKVSDNPDETNLEDINEFSESFIALESQMKTIINEIFDSDVCDIILNGSSIFSPINNGNLKYEQILDVLSNLYSKSIKTDMDKVNKKHIQKHTVKYVGVK